MPSYVVKSSPLTGAIEIPPSKSHTLRAILFGALAEGKTTIDAPLDSPDTEAMLNACSILGAKYKKTGRRLEIDGIGGCIHLNDLVIDAGNSGIVLRFISAIAALSKQQVHFTGDASLCSRPMGALCDGLKQLGARIQFLGADGFAPLKIQGPIQSGELSICGADSQPVSALLIAAALLKGKTALHIKNPGEKPWVELTLNWFDRLRIGYKNENYENYTIYGNGVFKSFEYQVPGDFSSAAFPLVAALVTNSELTLHNVDMQDVQGDKVLIPILQSMGACIAVDPGKKTIHVKKGAPLKAISIDMNPLIDALPILAVLGCFLEGETRLYNAAVARTKECNRISCMVEELKKMGGHVKEQADGLIIRKAQLSGACLHSHGDHRVAMALTVAGLGSSGQTQIDFVNCISKTFPSFLQDFQQLGANIECI